MNFYQKKWTEMVKRSRYSAKCYATENYLSYKTLETLVEIKQQFLELLISIGFVPGDINRRKQRYKDNIAEITGIYLTIYK